MTPTVAIIALETDPIRMPDGTTSPSALMVRGARCTLRVKQLDPVAAFYHSIQHAPLLADELLAHPLARAHATDGNGRSRLAVALDRYCAAYDDLRQVLSAHPGPDADDDAARAIRQALVAEYAPLLIALARERLARDLGCDRLGVRDYLGWFAASLGRDVGVWRESRFLHDYHQHGTSRPARFSTLVENNVTLLAELPDLDTGVFVDDDPGQLAGEIQLTPTDVRILRRHFPEFHLRDVEATRAVVRTLAAVVAPGDHECAAWAVGRFERAYDEGRRGV